jgi:hypothetical protein
MQQVGKENSKRSCLLMRQALSVKMLVRLCCEEKRRKGRVRSARKRNGCLCALHLSQATLALFIKAIVWRKSCSELLSRMANMFPPFAPLNSRMQQESSINIPTSSSMDAIQFQVRKRRIIPMECKYGEPNAYICTSTFNTPFCSACWKATSPSSRL